VIAAWFTAAFFLLLTFKLVVPALVAGVIAIGGIVYWGWELDVDVAAKIVLPCRGDISSGPSQRTIQEARLCAQLTEPAVCRVLDFGFTLRGDPFVVSELLSGETFDDRLLRVCRLPAVEAVGLLLPVLDALGAAHKKDIVHRDVKPANVFLASADGRVQPKLLDFGIACSSDVRSRMSLAGTICGTPCYMSPEQARGGADIDYRTDLWSFSVMLYEAVTGTAPFLHDDCKATLVAIASQAAPSLESLGFDGVLSRIVERGMAKYRDARWSSAAELADALAHWLSNQGFDSDVSGVSLRRRFLERSAAAAPVLLDVVEDVATERAFTYAPERRQKSGRLAIVGALAAVGLVAVVAVWAGQSALASRTDPVTPAVASVERPAPGPPLPIFEGVRREVAHSSPIPDDAAPPDAGALPAGDLAKVPPLRTRSPARRPPTPQLVESPALPELPSFPPASPFSRSPPTPSSADTALSRSATPPAKLPGKPPVRTGGVPSRDFGI
jgi:serine/threonine-protein kinase